MSEQKLTPPHCRYALDGVAPVASTHAGLWFDKFFAAPDNGQGKDIVFGHSVLHGGQCHEIGFDVENIFDLHVCIGRIGKSRNQMFTVMADAFLHGVDEFNI